MPWICLIVAGAACSSNSGAGCWFYAADCLLLGQLRSYGQGWAETVARPAEANLFKRTGGFI